MTNTRFLLALGLAPLEAVAVYVALLMIDPFEGADALATSLAVVGVVAGVSYSAVALLCLPVLTLLRHPSHWNPATVLAGGVTVGLVIALIADAPSINLARWPYHVAAGGAGLASALVFVLASTSCLKSRALHHLEARGGAHRRPPS